MQSLEIDGLKEVIQTLETTPEVIRQARAEFFDETGEVLLEAVQRHIGGSGRVAGVQESHVGSGKGYVAVRPMAKTNLDGYAAGYITNALENGHAVRPASGKAKRNGDPGQRRTVSRVNICTATPASRKRNVPPKRVLVSSRPRYLPTWREEAYDQNRDPGRHQSAVGV